MQTYRPQFEKWPGLIIDVTEEQIVTDLALAAEITNNLRHLDVKLAIDDFGRSYSSLVRLKELPFAELKLDRAFVTDCGSDKVNAPLCKGVSGILWPTTPLAKSPTDRILTTTTNHNQRPLEPSIFEHL